MRKISVIGVFNCSIQFKNNVSIFISFVLTFSNGIILNSFFNDIQSIKSFDSIKKNGNIENVDIKICLEQDVEYQIDKKCNRTALFSVNLADKNCSKNLQNLFINLPNMT